MMNISAFGMTDIGSTMNSENQDTFFVRDNLYGVFDGHGRAGRNAALTACTVFSEACLDSSYPEIFAQAEEAVSNCLSANPSAGGTTASSLYIDPIEGFCQVGHVGDSEVRYFDEDEGDGVSLTADHSACSLEEFKRIRKTPHPGNCQYASRFRHGVQRSVFIEKDGDWIANPSSGEYYCNVRQEWAAYLVCPYDEERLAVTRALGDFNMKKHGVIAEPTVTTVDAPALGVTRAIVLASDGLWDAMQYAEVRAIVRRPDLLGNAEAATAALMEAALATNARLFGTSADNITAVVVYLTMLPEDDDTESDHDDHDYDHYYDYEEYTYAGDSERDEDECTS